MTQKFYFHAATTSDTGTLPAAATSVSATSPTAIASGGDTNRSMDGTIGVSQASIVLTTAASTSAQASLIGRWLSLPIAAQTVANGGTSSVSISVAAAESNANSDFNQGFVVAVWRPGTGAVVGRVFDLDAVATVSEPGLTQTAGSTGFITPTTVVSQDGDVIVFEWWRRSNVQLMATAYTNTIFYDGTTEASITSEAAFIDFGIDITMFTASTRVPYTTPYPPLLAQ